MKNLYKLSILGLFLFSLSTSLQAQEGGGSGFVNDFSQPQTMLNVDWVIGLPMGKINENFISETSYRGVNFEYRYFFEAPISVGGGFTWQGFYEKKERGTYEFEGGAITSTKFNYLYNYPWYVNAHFYPLNSGIFYPYIGINTAMVNVEKSFLLGTFEFSDKSWHFGLMPEVGAIIRFSPESSVALNFKAKYAHIFYDMGDYKSINHLNFHLGFSFIY